MSSREHRDSGTGEHDRHGLGETAQRGIPAGVVAAHDDRLRAALELQVLAPDMAHHGAVPDETGAYSAHATATLIRECAAAYYQPQSDWHGDGLVMARMKLAVSFLERVQNNEDAPSDLADASAIVAVVQDLAVAAQLATMHDDNATVLLFRDFLRRAGNELVFSDPQEDTLFPLCAALAQVNALFPRRRYVAQIDAWLTDSITTDNTKPLLDPAATQALVVLATTLERPELLGPVRAHLDALAYLIHPNGDTAKEMLRPGDAQRLDALLHDWFALRYMAIHDNNAIYAALLAPLEPEALALSSLMVYPVLQAEAPTPAPLPESYSRNFPDLGVTRIRKGRLSASLGHGRDTHWIAARFGEAVVCGFRFAAAFFGRGEFFPRDVEHRDDGLYFRQELRGQYYQPLRGEALQQVTRENWGRLRVQRETSEECTLVYEAHIREIANGFEIRVHASGTDNVPLAVEIGLEPGGETDGVVSAPQGTGAFLVQEGYAHYRVGEDVMRIGPGTAEHRYTAVRGAADRISGTSFFLTGLTPFDHVFTLEMA